MKFHLPTAELFIPDGMGCPDALVRTTHLGIGAHQDDLEFMAIHGILAGFQNVDQWFCGVTCTDGAGSVRTGAYSACCDVDMRSIRRREQNLAAQIGQYAAMIQLDYPSADVKDPNDSRLREDLVEILKATQPRVVYTHNLVDKHGSHIAVAMAAIAAMRELPDGQRPAEVFGCEVWRGLDWLPDSDKILLDCSGHDSLASALNGVYDSQIAGGKRYDLGVVGRRRANATFFDAHAADGADSVTYAIDLSPLVSDPTLDIVEFIDRLVDKFRSEVIEKLRLRPGC